MESGPLALVRAEHVPLMKVNLCPLGRVHYFLVFSISNPLAPNLFIFGRLGRYSLFLRFFCLQIILCMAKTRIYLNESHSRLFWIRPLNYLLCLSFPPDSFFTIFPHQVPAFRENIHTSVRSHLHPVTRRFSQHPVQILPFH